MCEFCLDPSGSNNRSDQFHPNFAGFFSADAIDAAVRQANARRRAPEEQDDADGDQDQDSDGT